MIFGQQKVNAIIQLIRPAQWVKNFFVFLPLFFSSELFSVNKFFPVFIGFIVFALISSAIYCFNDILDVEADKKHPVKCKRPLAQGILTKSEGGIIMFFLVICSFSLSFVVSPPPPPF